MLEEETVLKQTNEVAVKDDPREETASASVSYADELLEKIKQFFPAQEQDLRAYSPLALAFIGDGIFELVVRTVVITKANRGNGDLHKMAVHYVKAPSQARMMEKIKPVLTPEESDVLRRGRNASPHSKAKNASLSEYHKATAFEALLGYLYLSGRTERMLELIRMGMDEIDAGR